MSEGWPESLKLEVKVSRTTKHQLSERDLKGIAPDGYAAILITGRLQHGPRWVLLPARQLQPGGYNDADLSRLADTIQPELCNELNKTWSNWILDESVWSKLLQQDHMKIKGAIEWCLKSHPPRVNKTGGNLRENRLAEALQRFRSRLDAFLLPSDNSAQQEGFIHQYLLAHALEKIGYAATVNPVGVPDIAAVKKERGAAGNETLRDKLLRWNPETPELKKLREQLLANSAETLEKLRQVIGH